MQKLIALLSRNKNTVIAVMLLLMISMSTLLLFWDQGVASKQKISLAHFGTHSVDSVDHPKFNTWEQVAENIEEGQSYFVLNENAEFVHLGENFIKDMNYNEDEILNQKFFPYIHQNDLPELMVSMIKVLQTGEPVANIGPYRIKANSQNSDDYHFCIATIIPITDEDEKVKELVIVHKDITDEVSSPEHKPSTSPKIRNEKNSAESRKIVQE